MAACSPVPRRPRPAPGFPLFAFRFPLLACRALVSCVGLAGVEFAFGEAHEFGDELEGHVLGGAVAVLGDDEGGLAAVRFVVGGRGILVLLALPERLVVIGLLLAAGVVGAG